MNASSPQPTPPSVARRRFVELTGPPGSEPPLIETALVIASEEYPELNVRNYLARLFAFRSVIGDRIAELAGRRVDKVPVDERIQILNHYLFEELKFHGDEDTFQDPDNSYLNQVIERRSGIPITLSMIYLEVAAGAKLRMGLSASDSRDTFS